MRDHGRRLTKRSTRGVILFCAFGLVIPWIGPSLWCQSTEQTNATAQQTFTQLRAQGSQALQQQDNVAAERAFREALALDPKSVPVLNNLAISLARQQRETEAISLYERALRLKPGDSVTRRNLGVAYFRAR